MVKVRNGVKGVIWFGVNIIVIFSLLTIDRVGITRASQNISTTEVAIIDPLVHIELEQKGFAQVLVILEDKADLHGAINFHAKAEKGAFVYQQLTNLAIRSQRPLRSFLDLKGIRYRSYWIQNMLMLTVNTQLLQVIARQPGIARIELYQPPYPDVMGNDLGPDFGPEFGPLPQASDIHVSSSELSDFGKEFGPKTSISNSIEWNIVRVHAPEVWAMGIDGSGVVIGHLDSGVQWDHSALIQSYRGNIGGPIDHNYNWFDGGESIAPIDYSSQGHGTHTLGTILGSDEPSNPAAAGNAIGVAPGAKWIACPGIGSPYVSAYDCFQFFLAPTDLYGNNPKPEKAPQVINNSWSGAGNYYPAIQALYAAGIFLAKSAGNNGPGCSTINNPAQWSEVTATAAFDQFDAIADLSSRGPVTFGHDMVVKPDIAAPGVNVRSSTPVNNYGFMTGTSMASPHVTGAVALLISANPELEGNIDILQMLLENYADPMINDQCTPFVDHPNDVWGWGILNIFDAVTAAKGVNMGTLTGTVRDASTMQPLSNALLIITDSVTRWNFKVSSDMDGNYLIELPAAIYNIAGSHYGYFDANVTGVGIEGGATEVQNIYLTPATVWTLSGIVSESITQNPLAASIDFYKTPVTIQTNPIDGSYVANISQGTYWMDVSSPGHSASSREVTVNQNLTEDFELMPIYNYYMHRSIDAMCGPTFNWMNAKGGTEYNLGDNEYIKVTFPDARSFTFYGNSYQNIYISSNGFVTFGIGETKWSGPLPDPATPNNGIYAFSTDLNPNGGTQGRVYTQILDNRYFVIEWYQVEHYPEGHPETFEIILDFDTNQIVIQFQIVSSTFQVVSGVENSLGTEATQYAYNDPYLLASNKAVIFYPQFGTPPPTGGQGELIGKVTDAYSGAPIDPATGFAKEFSTGFVHSFTTDISGTYSIPLCADWYRITVEADGYLTAIKDKVSVVNVLPTMLNLAMIPICYTCAQEVYFPMVFKP